MEAVPDELQANIHGDDLRMTVTVDRSWTISALHSFTKSGKWKSEWWIAFLINLLNLIYKDGILSSASWIS